MYHLVAAGDSASAATFPSPSIPAAAQLSPLTAGTSNAIALPGCGGMSPLQSAAPPSVPPSGVTTGLDPASTASAGARPPHAINPTEKQRRLPAQRMPAPQRRETRGSGRPGARPQPLTRGAPGP